MGQGREVGQYPGRIIAGMNESGEDTNTSEAILAFDNVTLGYGERKVLEDISLRVHAGKVVAIMGGSGSGKTTLLKAATGQLTASRGHVTVFGENIAAMDITALQSARQKMGVLFQQGALFTDLNVFENVAFPLREHLQLTAVELRDTVLKKLQAVGLRAAAHLKVSELSGGMARRVALARAIVMNPELILYDEPFAGLDPISMGVTARLIRHLSDSLGCASVIITHDVADSFAIANQVYLIGQGKLKAQGTPPELLASADPYVKQFLGGLPDGPVAFDYPTTPAFDGWLQKQMRQP